MTDKIDVAIFSCAEYAGLVENCVQSLQQCIRDPINEIHVISNIQLNCSGTNSVLDHVFWEKIDPAFAHSSLYKANWIKQQIMKLNMDLITDRPCVVIDAEVVFLRPMSWIENGRINLFTSSSRLYPPYFDLIDTVLGLGQRHTHSFITDAMLFEPSVLKQIKANMGLNWLTKISKLLENSLYQLSEFELYGTYVTTLHADRYQIRHTGDHVILLDHRQTLCHDDLVQVLQGLTSNPYISANIAQKSYTGERTQWITWYTSIKDPSWPNCDSEQNFAHLPIDIQKECIEKFGYKLQ